MVSKKLVLFKASHK